MSPVAWAEVHHVRRWLDGGLTDLDNLVMCNQTPSLPIGAVRAPLQFGLRRGRSWVSAFDVAEQVSVWSSIPLTLIGFAIALWEISKTKSAAEAAKIAAEAARDRSSNNALLVLFPQLQRAEEELERAVREQSVESAISWLGNWRWQAGQVRGFLQAANQSEHKKFLKTIQASVSAAASVKSSLINSDPNDLASLTVQARDAIAAVTDEVGTLAAMHGLQIGEK